MMRDYCYSILETLLLNSAALKCIKITSQALVTKRTKQEKVPLLPRKRQLVDT